MTRARSGREVSSKTYRLEGIDSQFSPFVGAKVEISGEIKAPRARTRRHCRRVRAEARREMLVGRRMACTSSLPYAYLNVPADRRPIAGVRARLDVNHVQAWRDIIERQLRVEAVAAALALQLAR